MKNLFSSSEINRHKKERSVVRNVTGDFLEEKLAGSTNDNWMNDPIGEGIKNTQQLMVDWSDFSKHVFFNSAEAKVNLAFDQIINGYPFDGTSVEKSTFLASIGGYTKYILDSLDSNLGYMNFSRNPNAFDNVFPAAPTNASYLEVLDSTGLLAPDLAKIVGDAKATAKMHLNGSTIEFWIYIDSGSRISAANDYSIIYQKADTPDSSNETRRAVTVWQGQSQLNTETNKWEYPINFMIGSDNFKSIHHEITKLEEDRWHHVCFTYERSLTERVLGYLDGRYQSKTEVDQAELDDITCATGHIRIGWTPVKHLGYASNALADGTKMKPFRGLLDELRIWLGPRSSQNILRYHKRNVDAQDTLLVCYRFNEPSPTNVIVDGSPVSRSYGAKTIVLDYSGNALHTQIYNPAYGTIDGAGNLLTEGNRDPHGSIGTPVALERVTDNHVLFPDWSPNVALNTGLIQEGNHYDRNNPNIITNLVPRHYFEEAKFFEGVDSDWEEPDPYGISGITSRPIPGHGEMPAGLVMMYFLLTWANFFDDMKLYLDHFSLMDKVSYDNYDQIPPQLIMFLSDYYGINLPDPYINETPDRYKEGENLSLIHI